MKRCFTLLLLFTALPLLAQHAHRIQDAMANYDYEKAIALIEKEKPTPALLLQKGKALKELSHHLDALQTFQEVIAHDSLNQRAYIEAAECCKQLTKYSQALDFYRKAIDINPDNKYVKLQYISLLCNTQQFREAFGESSILAETDSSAVVLHLQAQSLEGMEDMLDSAIGCYHVIQDKYPEDYLAAAKLGNLYNLQSLYDYAIEATEKYRERDTTNIVVNRQNALAYCLKKDYPTAIQRYKSLINQGDSTFHTCYYLGVSYYAIERYYEAHDLLEVARKYDPKNVNLLYYLGRACAKTSWKKQGIEYLEEALALTIPQDSTLVQLYKGLRESCRLGGDFPKEIQATKELYKYDKNNHILLYGMARTYAYHLKDKKTAMRYLQAFLKTKPKDTDSQPAPEMKEDEVRLNETNYYRAAEKWLADLQKEIQKEEFFIGGSVSPQ